MEHVKEQSFKDTAEEEEEDLFVFHDTELERHGRASKSSHVHEEEEDTCHMLQRVVMYMRRRRIHVICFKE